LPRRFSALFDDPKHWRGRAEEARAIAPQLKGAESQQTMLEIAAQYDLLAEHAERRMAEKAHGDETR
jgi:hypothetical protein